jgi:hypothetical protein
MPEGEPLAGIVRQGSKGLKSMGAHVYVVAVIIVSVVLASIVWRAFK